MRYFLKDNVTDEMLIAVGFYKYSVYEEFLRNVSDDVQIWIPLENVVKYEKRRLYNNYGENALIIPYIKDLLDLNYVEVRND